MFSNKFDVEIVHVGWGEGTLIQLFKHKFVFYFTKETNVKYIFTSLKRNMLWFFSKLCN